MGHPPVVLASTSPFRRDLLTRLGIAFETAAPGSDETERPNETPRSLVLRLAESKARAVAAKHPSSLIIGSDQVAVIDGEILGKPGDRSQARRQLEMASGRLVTFYTGLCLLNSSTGRSQSSCEPYRVRFRRLSAEQIEGYIDRERPFDCAGSFKSEGLGIALFDRMEGEDPTSLVGLPLIRLVEMLQQEGLDVLTSVSDG